MTRVLLVLALLAPLAGCAASERAPLAEAAVEILSWQFTPAQLDVSAGTRVTFTNRDAVEHTVTATNRADWGVEGSDPEDWLGLGETWAFTFWKPGVFRYECIPHANMTGTVIVR